MATRTPINCGRRMQRQQRHRVGNTPLIITRIAVMLLFVMAMNKLM